MTERVRAHPHPESLERSGRLPGPRTSRRNGVQDGDDNGIAGETDATYEVKRIDADYFGDE